MKLITNTFKNLKISYKITWLCTIITVLFSVCICWIYFQLKDNLYKAKQIEVKFAVESTWGVIDHYRKLAESGEMDSAEAQ